MTDAIGGITQYQYNGDTDLTTIADAAGHITAYAYDPLRRLSTVTDPLGRQKHYSYDADGDITGTLDGNSKTNTFGYDALNRLTSMSLADGKNVAYSYDAMGNRLTMADWRGVSLYNYDLLNRVTSVATPDGKSVGYSNDAVGSRATLSYPDGRTVQYTYDALNRLTKVTDWASKTTNYSYDAAGNLIGLAHPNGAASTYQYDPANRLTNVVNRSGSSTLSSFAYLLDKVGNRTQMTTSAAGVNQFGYDSLYRLTSWTPASGQATHWTYDPVGNRQSMTSSAGITNYTYDAADQLLTAGTSTFTYDGNGNQLAKLTGGTTVNYGWDALSRLISVVGGTTNTQYRYDGDGNRVAQQIPSGTYAYANDTATALPVVLNENGPDGNIDYAYGLSMISATAANVQYYYQFDGLGSNINITDQTGAQKANYSYDPWGKLTVPLDPLGSKEKYKFAGEAADLNAGLVFLRARYYDPAIGRFLGPDRTPSTQVLPLGNNKYQYVLSNPLRFTDPFGLGVIEAFSGFFGLAGQSRANETQKSFDACMANFDSCDLDRLAQQQQATEVQAVQNAELAGSGSADLIYSAGNVGFSGTGGAAFSAVGTFSDVAGLAVSPSKIRDAFTIPSAGGDATGSALCIVNPYACSSTGGGLFSPIGCGVTPGATSSVRK